MIEVQAAHRKDLALPILELLDYWGEGRNLQLGQ